MALINCLTSTPELQELIEKVRAEIPAAANLSDEVITAKIGANQTEQGELPSFEILKKSFQETSKEATAAKDASQYIDFSALDEIANLSYPNAQIKADRINLIARSFSQIATVLYNKTVKKGETRSRASFIAENLETIIQALRTQLFNPNNPRYTEYQRNEIVKLLDNWDILFGEAANILYSTENISIETVVVEHNEGDETGNKEDEINPDGENRVSTKDGWMYKARELDLRDTLSQETRKILSSIKRVDRNGNPLVDDLGLDKYLNPDQAHLTLLEKISTINNSSEFIPALEELAQKHPWVNQVLDTINEDLQQPFPTITPKLYSDLRKEFVPYYVQVANSDGTIGTKQVNKTPSVYYLFEDWRSNIEQYNVLDSLSVYDNKGEYSRDNAMAGKKVIEDINKKLDNSDEDNVINAITESLPRMGRLLNMVGIEFSEQEILDTLTYNDEVLDNAKELLSSLDVIFSQINKNGLKAGTDLINEFSGPYTAIAKLFNAIPEGAVIATFREAGKSRQSYSAPSYMGRVLNAIKNSDRQKVAQYLQNEYLKYRQFRDEVKCWSPWIDLMSDKYNEKGRLVHDGQPYRNLLDRKVVVHRDGIEFNDWTPQDYFNVAMTEFLSTKDSNIPSAYYALPLLADAPSAEFIKFIKYTDTMEYLPDGSFKKAKDIILDKLTDVAWKEWERINIVRLREAKHKDPSKLREGERDSAPIANFDGAAGKRFNFFPFLNDQMDRLYEASSPEAVRNILRQEIEKNEAIEFENFVEQFNSTNQYSEENMESFFYNNALAYTQMIQLFTTDLAYYKNLNDFQKRFKEVYAMTNRVYTNLPGISKTRRAIYLKDIVRPSNVYDEIKQCLDSIVRKGNITKEQAASILSAYEEVNVTDAQGFVSLNAYKKVMMMQGNWTQEMEDAKIRMEEGTFSPEDFNIVWQTMKPFVFTQRGVESGITGNTKNGAVPYGQLKVPVQYKNSEFLLLAMFDTVAKSQAQSPFLRALSSFIEKNDIDLVQFESGVKAGNQSPLDFNRAINEKWGEREITEFLDKATRLPDTIQETSWEDYGIITATPEHLVDHEVIIGSQFKKLITADNDERMTIKVGDNTLDSEGIYRCIQNIFACDYIEGFDRVQDIFSSKENLEKAIQRELAGNTRYTDEEKKACTLVETENGVDFQVPLHDPIQSQKIQQLLNSMIKRDVTRQETTGASCVQVSNVGLSDEVAIRFKDESGNFIFNEKEFLGLDKVSRDKRKLLGDMQSLYGKSSEGFKKYKSATKASSIAYMECLLPAYSKRMFTALGLDEGNFDINDLPEELRKSIGYRTPTEAKYSMQPIYIKGFLPQNNGSAIMLPSEITTMVGSDFDIDKVSLFLNSVRSYSRAERDALKEFNRLNGEDIESDALMEALFGEEAFSEESAKERKSRFKEWLKGQREEGNFLPDENGIYNGRPDRALYKRSPKLEGTDINSIKNLSKEERHGLMIDIAFEVLTNEYTNSQILKPGGFDEASRMAAITTVIENISMQDFLKEFLGDKTSTLQNLDAALEKLYSVDTKTAKKLAEKYSSKLNPLSFETQAYFHSQNANGGKMIGVYAVAGASHALGQHDSSFSLASPIEFLGRELSNIDPLRDFNGKLVSENIANFLAASVDNVKDPVLKALNQDSRTGDMTCFLLRCGVPLSEAATFMTASYITYTPSDGQEVPAPLTINNLRRLKLLEKQTFTSKQDKEVVDGLKRSVGYYRYKLQQAARDLTQVTQAYRGDAMSSAAGPTLGHNIARTIRLQNLQNNLSEEIDASGKTVKTNPSFSINSDFINMKFVMDSDEASFATENMLIDSEESTSPMIYAATKCGVMGANYLLSNVFPQLNDNLMQMFTDPNHGIQRYIDLSRVSADTVAKLVDDMMSDFVLYQLNGTEFFGTRPVEYYLKDFPAEFTALKKKYPEVLNTNSLTKSLFVESKGSYPRIRFKNTGNLTKAQRASITNDWSMLLTYNREPKEGENPKEVEKEITQIRNLGFKLFNYASHFGLTYSGPSSFIQFAPNVLRRSIKDYDRTVRNLGNAKEVMPFVYQYVHNHLDNLLFFRKLSASSIRISPEGTFYKAAAKKGSWPMLYSVYDQDGNEVMYEATSSFETTNNEGKTIYKVQYQRATPLGIKNSFKEYYYGEANPTSRIDFSKILQNPLDIQQSEPMILAEDTPLSEEDIIGIEGEEEETSPTPEMKGFDENGNEVDIC